MESNKKPAPPLIPRELLPQMVTDADMFSALRYCRGREEAPALTGLEQTGRKVLPGVSAALADTYYSLWSEGAELKPVDQIPPVRQYWQTLLSETMESSAFQGLQSKTRGSHLLSLIGTIEAGRTILGLVPADDADKLQELSEVQAEADALEQEAESVQKKADTLQELAEQMLATGQMSGQSVGQSSTGQPGRANGESGSDSSSSEDQGEGEGQAGGQPQTSQGSFQASLSGGGDQLTAEQAQALADKLAELWAKAQAKADAAKAEAEAGRELAQDLADSLMGQSGNEEAEEKLRELARLGMAAVKQADEKVSQVFETIQGWGLESAELEHMDMPEAVRLVERMRRNSTFVNFAKLLGRIRAIARKKAKSQAKSEDRKVSRVEWGRDISRAYSTELTALVHPATRHQTLKRWARGELRLRGTEAKREQGHGPVVVCEDSSGSMDGSKRQWAKAVTLALAQYAKMRRRDFGWIMFDSRIHAAKTYPAGKLSARQLLEIAESGSGGGTDFEKPLRKALEMIKTGRLKKADIVFVTDGDCAVSTDFLRDFLAAKKALEFSVFTVICDTGDHVSDETVKKFSDKVERASFFTAEEAERRVFSHL